MRHYRKIGKGGRARKEARRGRREDVGRWEDIYVGHLTDQNTACLKAIGREDSTAMALVWTKSLSRYSKVLDRLCPPQAHH